MPFFTDDDTNSLSDRAAQAEGVSLIASKVEDHRRVQCWGVLDDTTVYCLCEGFGDDYYHKRRFETMLLELDHKLF